MSVYRNMCVSDKLGKQKKQFDTQEDADDFLRETGQRDMVSYPCPLCGKWHTAHRQRGLLRKDPNSRRARRRCG